MTSSARGKPVRSVVAGTDFSAYASRAAKRAALLAAALEARLELLHVVESRSLALAAGTLGKRAARAAFTESAHAMMDAALESLPRGHGARVQGRVVVGDVLDELYRAGARSGLLVVGARGRHTMRDALLGTTAGRLLHKGRHPLLVVKQGARHGYRHVVVATDFSADARAALDAALRLAPRARITLVHAFEAEFEGLLGRGAVRGEVVERLRSQARSRASDEMTSFAARLEGRAERVDRVITRGYPPRVVLETAARRGADLIAVGKHGRSALGRLLIGSLTQHVLEESHCDVLVSRR